MTASTPTTVSPARVRMARKTPWAEGCCGPMFIVRRSLPPYPISMTFRASGSMVTLVPLRGERESLHRRVRRRVEDDRLHLEQDRRRLGEERVPLRVLHHLGADRGTVVEIVVGPEVHRLVE